MEQREEGIIVNVCVCAKIILKCQNVTCATLSVNASYE